MAMAILSNENYEHFRGLWNNIIIVITSAPRRGWPLMADSYRLPVGMPVSYT